MTGLLAGAFVCARCAPLHASEDERALSLVPAYGTLSLGQGEGTQTLSAEGGMLSVDYERGVTDALWFRATGGAGVFASDQGTIVAGTAIVGLTYAFDVLRYVPYANLGAGILWTEGAVAREVRPVLELGFGLDVLTSRTASYGLVMRFQSFASQSAYFTIGPRITWRWGFF
jgi:hypothetical protein